VSADELGPLEAELPARERPGWDGELHWFPSALPPETGPRSHNDSYRKQPVVLCRRCRTPVEARGGNPLAGPVPHLDTRRGSLCPGDEWTTPAPVAPGKDPYGSRRGPYRGCSRALTRGGGGKA